MKKLLFVFITLFMLLLTTGCGTKQNTVRFNSEDGSSEKESAVATEEVTEEATTDGETDEDTEVTEEEKTDGKEVVNDKEAVKEEKTTEKKTTAATITPSGKLTVTSFDGAFLKTNYSFNVVKGDAPIGTKKITVNDYKLSKYIGGQTKWDYIASTRYGTLENGLNTYVVKALDANGEEIDSLIFSINYEASATPQILPGVGTSHWLTLLTAFIITGLYTVFRKYRWL